MRYALCLVCFICLPLLSRSVPLGWASYFGGTDDEYGYAIACDPAGNVYIAGSATSSSHIASVGAYQTTYGGLGDAFLAKFNSSGVLQWATYFGGSGIDQANGIACDSTGNVYITGLTNSLSDIASSGAYQTSKGGSGTDHDAFLAKFNSSGSLQWATYFGGSGDDEGDAVTCDTSGNVYITGMTSSTSNIAGSGSYQTSMGGAEDVFIAKFNTSGQVQWSTYYGGLYGEQGNSIACSASGNIFITGYTYSANNIVTPGAYQTVLDTFSAENAFLSMFNSSGFLQWGTYFGGNLPDEGFAVVCDTAGNVYMGGSTSDTGLSTTSSFQPSIAGGQDGYLAKFNDSGHIQWSTYYGGTSYDEITSLAMDASGNIYAGGSTQSTSGIATAGNYQTTLAAGGDGFVIKFNAAGQRLWGSYFGGNTAFDYINGVSCDGNGDVFFTGYTASDTDIATAGSHQSHRLSNGYTAFIGKFSADTSVRINQPFTDTVLCAGTSFNLDYSVSTNFDAGNIFTAQLSDVTGDFSSPVTIGSVSAVSSGTIACTIPGNAQSMSYRIRIYASNPPDTSDDDQYNIQIDTGGSAHVSISSNPAIPVSGQPAIFTATAVNGGTSPFYQWRKNGVAISGATSNPYTGTFVTGDVISVVVHSNRPCTSPDSATSNSETAEPLGVNNLANEVDNVVVFPNPNDGAFTVEGSLKNGNYTIEMINVAGQTVYNSVINVNKSILETRLNLDMPTGVYMLLIKSETGMQTGKQVILGK
jgi:hypothetical protein